MINKTRQENVFQYQEKAQNLPQSKFDLSHDHKTTFTMGELSVFLMCETIPGDNFSLSNELFIRFQPLYYPIMHRINVKTWYFYCPNRILWPGSELSKSGWMQFISKETEVTAHPTLKITETTLTSDFGKSLIEYMGFPTPTGVISPTLDIDINALPVAAYHKIWDDFFRRPQIQLPEFVPLTAGDNTAAYDAIPGGWNVLRRRNWNPDYYTAALPMPQAGAEMLIPMTNFQDRDYLTGPPGNPDIESTRVKGPYQLKRVSDDVAFSPGTIEQSGVHPYGGVGLNFGGSHMSYIDIQSTAGTIRQLRLASKLQEYLERLNRTGDRYRDVLRVFFASDPMEGVIDFTEFIGSSSGQVTISDVMSHTETSVDFPLGSYSGKAMAIQGSKVHKYKCYEHGIILGIINIQPRSSYYQGLSKTWTRTNKYDYAWNDFAHIGDEILLSDELVFDYRAPSKNGRVFGYIPRYSSYRYMNDVISAEMRTEWKDWHMARFFDVTDTDTILLNNEFLQCKPRVNDVFQTAVDTHEIFCHVWNNVQVWRSLPKYGVPRF